MLLHEPAQGLKQGLVGGLFRHLHLAGNVGAGGKRHEAQRKRPGPAVFRKLAQKIAVGSRLREVDGREGAGKAVPPRFGKFRLVDMAQGRIGKAGPGKNFFVNGNVALVSAMGQEDVEIPVRRSRETVAERLPYLSLIIAESMNHCLLFGEGDGFQAASG